jgi:hypothetical protein
MIKPDQKIVVSSHEELDWAYTVSATDDAEAAKENSEVATGAESSAMPSASEPAPVAATAPAAESSSSNP